LKIDKAGIIELFRVNNSRVYVSENLKLVRTADIVPITGSAKRHHTLFTVPFYLVGLERLDHAVLFGHLPNPSIRLYAHCS
jgi:hypothetical protein